MAADHAMPADDRPDEEDLARTARVSEHYNVAVRALDCDTELFSIDSFPFLYCSMCVDPVTQARPVPGRAPRGFEGARRDRWGDRTYQLKDYHNLVKRSMIAGLSSNAASLLDLACGRGGDLRKWFDAGIQRVHAVDISEASIVEAQSRLDDLRKQRSTRDIQYLFEVRTGPYQRLNDGERATREGVAGCGEDDERGWHAVGRKREGGCGEDEEREWTWE